MGLREELQAVDPEQYSQVRAKVEAEWERAKYETRKEKFLALLNEYPVLATEARLAISSAAGWDGGTFFGSQEMGVARESLVGAVSLVRYAEKPTT
jgi:hypothetical protein